jgi:hypothetical protein
VKVKRGREREQKFFFDFVLLIFNLLSAFHSLRNKTIFHMRNLLLLLFQWETNKYVRHYINKTSIIFLFFFLLFLSFYHVLFVKASKAEKTNRRKIISFFLFCSTHRKRKKPLGRKKTLYTSSPSLDRARSFSRLFSVGWGWVPNKARTLIRLFSRH